MWGLFYIGGGVIGCCIMGMIEKSMEFVGWDYLWLIRWCGCDIEYKNRIVYDIRKISVIYYMYFN